MDTSLQENTGGNADTIGNFADDPLNAPISEDRATNTSGRGEHILQYFM